MIWAKRYPIRAIFDLYSILSPGGASKFCSNSLTFPSSIKLRFGKKWASGRRRRVLRQEPNFPNFPRNQILKKREKKGNLIYAIAPSTGDRGSSYSNSEGGRKSAAKISRHFVSASQGWFGKTVLSKQVAATSWRCRHVEATIFTCFFNVSENIAATCP